jgi:hypothetical protein
MTDGATDPVSDALLPVFRHFLSAFLSPETQGWRLGFATAVGTWGDARGLAIANAAQNFVAVVLQNRPVSIGFCDPLDLNKRAQTTADENELSDIITHWQQSHSTRSDSSGSESGAQGRYAGGTRGPWIL